ncbi:Do family serine endopeptidase [Flavobacterium sp. '19STA2R22 D10 B1']|uniref:Do family serine endopeptidase n=1 Tax=Flavobacterium aerium TaxID=3037261 RepID=UPI00278BE931|nr:Do family serine endopeptidase [Flavobacterium sp. '19STA2R22 D10 B1']
MKTFSSLFLVSLLSGVITLGAYKLLTEHNLLSKSNNAIITTTPANFIRPVGLSPETLDFTEAADKAVHSVVHVKNVTYTMAPSNPMAEFFYGYKGGQQQAQIGTGSGVIISEDGYIVTNNHVIKDASEIEVTLNNNKSYKARLIGTDSKMDVALLKVDASEKLPYATFGNSDNIKVGEWVLAVGNPYNLTSTVTAGIVSAKARNLGTGAKSDIQSFIQTDAAVNPGNSGGALVNTRGELIGINTMISSMTGSYVGYSFAVPSNITRKIIEDLMEFGNVQRGILGIEGGELNSTASKELGINETQGFYVNRVTPKSGAEKAGLKKGDIVIQLDNTKISSYAELSGFINTKRPNDVVNVTILRDNKTVSIPVTLSKNELSSYEYNGLQIENISDVDKKKFNINYGVKIKGVSDESFGELTGKIILSVNNQKVTDVAAFSKILNNRNPNALTKIDFLNENGQLERYLLKL